MKLAQHNLLNLTQPEKYRGFLAGYMMEDYPYLTIVLVAPVTYEKSYVNFEGVKYLECPVLWLGCDFCLAADETCRKFVQTLPEEISDDIKLYVVKRTEPTAGDSWVRILAKSFQLTLERPYFS